MVECEEKVKLAEECHGKAVKHVIGDNVPETINSSRTQNRLGGTISRKLSLNMGTRKSHHKKTGWSH